MLPIQHINLFGHSLEFVRIPSGNFKMGSPHGLPIETPPREVNVKLPFWMATVLVTQELWSDVMRDNPSAFTHAESLPVDGVSYDMATSFCQNASEIAGHSFALPTEAQWEFACRAGTSSEYFWGESPDQATHYAWFELNSRERTHEVGSLQPNPWGLHDMVGNLWEWCEDVWHSDYHGSPPTQEAWNSGVDRQPRRCLRGGAWDMDAFRLRSAYRSFDHAELATTRFGLRLVVNSQSGRVDGTA